MIDILTYLNSLNILLQPLHGSIILLHGHEVAPLSLRIEERVGRLDNFNVLVKVSRQTPRAISGPDKRGAVIVREDGELGVEQTLDFVDWQSSVDPFLGRRELSADTMVVQPGKNSIDSLIRRLDQFADLVGGQVLAIASVRGVRNLAHMAVQLLMVVLGKTDLEVDHVVVLGGARYSPAPGNGVDFLDCIATCWCSEDAQDQRRGRDDIAGETHVGRSYDTKDNEVRLACD